MDEPADDDEVTRLRACVKRLTLALAEASGEAERWRPKVIAGAHGKGDGRRKRVTNRREYLEPDVKELATALDRWHRMTGSIMLPADVVLACVKGLGYRR